METSPYSIYTENRPIRIAFLVRPEEDLGLIDAIFEYNNGKWGGRFNAIFITDGENFEDHWWKFLVDFDPDIIHSTVKLTDELKKRIETSLSPLSIEENEQSGIYISSQYDPIDILPTKKNVSAIARDFFGEESSIVIFEVDETTPDVIIKFLKRNFGLIKTQQMFYFHQKRSLEECNVVTYKITDFASLNKALLDLGDFHKRVVYPIQICSLPNSFKDIKYKYDNEKFNVVIGNSINELIYLWNRPLYIGSWMRTDLTQFWIPEELINNSELHSGLSKFINRYTARIGNQNQQGTHFTSFTLSDEELKKISDSFIDNFWHRKTFVKLEDFAQIPDYGEKYSFLRVKQGLDFFRAHSTEEHIILSEPDVLQGGMGGQHWLTDIYIQFIPERFRNTLGVDYWWRLPRRNNILYENSFFNKPARINEHGTFSVLMDRSHDFNRDANHLILKIPEDRSIFRSLFCGKSFNCFDKDMGARFRSQPFNYLQRSDQGQYLDGVISLFPDLLNAHNTFENRFWRKIFEKMSNQSDVQDIKKKEEIKNTLLKSIQRGRDFKNTDEDIEWLAGKVLVFSKAYSKKEIDLSFKQLMAEAQSETEEYNKNVSGDATPTDEKEFKRSLSTLLEWKIFSIGVFPKCPKCGYRIWYSLDEIEQSIICSGCRYNFILEAETEWFYRLNNLVRGAVSVHGTIPVLLALGQIASDAHSSFMYMPSIELLNRDKDKYIIEAEVDLLCIKDGEFIIGEVKKSIGLFEQGDFDKIEKIARLVKPDRVLFSSFDKKPDKYVTLKIENLQEALKDLGVKVEWYPIHRWAFEARPVR